MPQPSFRGSVLRAVRPVEDGDLGHVRLLTVEIYEDGVIVRWVLPKVEFPVERDEPLVQVSLSVSDDLGTDYQFVTGGWRGSGGAPIRGEAIYAPGAPVGARRLSITHEGASAGVDLAE